MSFYYTISNTYKKETVRLKNRNLSDILLHKKTI